MKPRNFLIRVDLEFFDDRDGSAQDIMPRTPLVTVAPDIGVEASAALLNKSEFYKLILIAGHSFVGLFAA